MEVDARFHCPEPRTIVMTIIRGEGVGSDVETHATPLEAGLRLGYVDNFGNMRRLSDGCKQDLQA